LQSATACADLNENGVCDAGETSVTTAADGSFTLSLTKSVPILVITNDNTTDSDGNTYTAGTVLKAPAGATVVSVATTMLAAGATNAQVATALGYPAGTDFNTLNPFKATATGTDAEKKEAKLKFETAAMQVYTTVAAIAAGASSGGASTATAFGKAFQAVKDQAVAANGPLDLTDATVVDAIALKAQTGMAGVANFDAAKFENARADLKATVKNVNEKIKAVTVNTYQTADQKQLYGVATKNVGTQMASRVKDSTPVPLSDSTNFDAVLAEQKKSASSTPVALSEVVGIWEGKLGTGANDPVVSAVLLPSSSSTEGTAWVVVNKIENNVPVPRVIKASLTVNGGLLSGSGQAFAANAITSNPTSMTASLDNASLVGSLQTATGRESYKLDVANSTLYNTRAQLNDFAKTWSSSSMNDSGRAYQWTFTSAGALTGSSVTTGCEYTGQLSFRSEGKAIVNVEVVETCPGQTTSLTYRGIAFTKNGQAVFTMASDKGAALFKFPAPQQ
jgi:hypothetical protein